MENFFARKIIFRIISSNKINTVVLKTTAGRISVCQSSKGFQKFGYLLKSAPKNKLGVHSRQLRIAGRFLLKEGKILFQEEKELFSY